MASPLFMGKADDSRCETRAHWSTSFSCGGMWDRERKKLSLKMYDLRLPIWVLFLKSATASKRIHKITPLCIRTYFHKDKLTLSLQERVELLFLTEVKSRPEEITFPSPSSGNCWVKELWWGNVQKGEGWEGGTVVAVIIGTGILGVVHCPWILTWRHAVCPFCGVPIPSCVF